MSITITFPFDNPTNYTYDPNEVEITGGNCLLKLIDLPGLNFNQPFTTDTGFVYDSALAEFTGGLVQQKDQRPTNSLIGSTFTSSLDGNWGASGVSLNHTANGTPFLTGGKVQCYGANGIFYDDSQFGALAGDWVAKFEYIPNYTTGPATNVNIFAISQAAGTTDQVVIFNSPSGNNLRITANGLSASTFGSWTPTAGQAYVFEIICISNQVSLYVDNVQIGTAKTITPGQGTSSDRVWLGAYTGVYNLADGEFDNFILYSATAQTDVYTVPEAAFLSSIVELPQFSYSGNGNIQSFDGFTTSEAGTPRYTLNGLYWTGSAWVASNNTYSQASTETIVNSNISTLPASDTLDIKLFFEDTNTQSSADDLTTNYTGQEFPQTNPRVQMNTTVRADALFDISETSTKLGSDEIKYNFLENGNPIWFDGAIFTASNGTYAESNTEAELKAQLPINAGVATTYGLWLYLHSDDGTTTPLIDEVSFAYDVAGPERDDVFLCEIWFDSSQIDGDVETQTVTVNIENDDAIYKGTILVTDEPQVLTPDVEGRYTVKLVETINMNKTKEGLEQTYILTVNDRIFRFNVPEENTSNLFGNLA